MSELVTSNSTGNSNVVILSELPAAQQKAIELLLRRRDDEPLASIAAKIPLSERQLYRYLNDEQFIVALRIARDAVYASFDPIADRKLFEAVRTGDVKALQLYFRKRGELVTKFDGELSVGGTIDVQVGIDFSRVPAQLAKLVLDIAGGKLDPSVIDISKVDGLLLNAKNVTPTAQVQVQVQAQVETAEIEIDHGNGQQLWCADLPIREAW